MIARAAAKCQGRYQTQFLIVLYARSLYRFASLHHFAPPPPTCVQSFNFDLKNVPEFAFVKLDNRLFFIQ